MGTAIWKITGEQPNMEKLLSIEKNYSFENLTNRKRGIQNKKFFLRKGIAGDWKNHFSSEAKHIFNKYAGQELILLGYEKNDKWTEKNNAK
ncbi:MAG: sulfotransferase domain-containing protein [Desulfococcaceae bacterium]